MDEVQILIALVLAALAMAVGYGIYSSILADTGEVIDETGSNLEDKKNSQTNWPISRCLECDSEKGYQSPQKLHPQQLQVSL